MRVTCIGAAHWDLIARAGAPLAPGGDVPGRIERRPGGVALNIALALARAGASVALRAAIARDEAGDALVAAIAWGGVDVTGLSRPEGSCDCYLAIETEAGELFGAVADCRALEAEASHLVAPSDTGLLVVDGNLPLAALTPLAALPGPLALVPASPEKAARLRPFLRRPETILYLNRREAGAILGADVPDAQAAAEALLREGAAEVLVTDGPRPATHACPDGVFSATPPALGRGGVTGAGDRLVAAHLTARARGLAPGPALRQALDRATAREMS